MKPVFFLFAFTVFLSVFQGCKGNDKMDIISGVPFIVKSAGEMKLLESSVFSLNAQNLTSLPEATDGACGVGTFKIDFNKYVDSKYYEAEAMSWVWTSVGKVVVKEGADPVVSDTIALAKGCNVVRTILFLGGDRMVVRGKEYVYELSYDVLNVLENNAFRFDLNILYSETDPNDTFSQKENVYIAFDLNDFFKQYSTSGKPDTFNVSVKYCKGWTSGGLYEVGELKIPSPVIIP